MNDPIPNANASQADVEIARERTKQVTVVGWTAGITGIGSVYELSSNPTWPFAFGVAAVAAMVGFVCHSILRRA